MKKFLLSVIAVGVTLNAAPLNDVDANLIVGTYSYKGDNVKEVNVGVDLRKYAPVSENVLVGAGVSGTFSDNKSDFGNGNDGYIAIGDVFAAGKLQLMPNISADAMVGYSAGSIDGDSMDSMVIGAGLKYTSCCSRKLTVGIDWKENINIDTDKIAGMDGENIDRYGVTIGYSF